MRLDERPDDLELADASLFPGFRRLFAVAVLIGPGVGLLQVILWLSAGLILRHGLDEIGRVLLASLIFFLIALPVAYAVGLVPSALGAFVLYQYMRRKLHPQRPYLAAALCGFAVQGLPTTVVMMRTEAVEDPVWLLSLSFFGIIPAMATQYCYRRGLFAFADEP